MTAKINKIIAVASGKGGVGKSTVAVNLALALVAKGFQVGLLDADLYGPSQPTLLGAADEKPELIDKLLQPVRRYGLASMSIGYLIAKTAPAIWRGPMLGKAVTQLLQETHWGELDYLIVDLPPGTGDIQLTLCQKIPLHAALIVTTPQDIALLDVRRAAEMFIKMSIPLVGVVENMSSFHCPHCAQETPIFGQQGGGKIAREYAIPLLAQIPLSVDFCQTGDNGRPVMVQAESKFQPHFMQLAQGVINFCAQQPKDYSHKFPKIVVEHTKEQK